MTKTQITVFEELLKDKDFKGKSKLRHLLWLNTSKPKFNVGECFKVTDHSVRIYGHTIIDFGAKIVRVFSQSWDEEWHYELELEVTAGEKSTTTKYYAVESKLSKSMRCNDNKTVLLSSKSESPQSIDVNIL